MLKIAELYEVIKNSQNAFNVVLPSAVGDAEDQESNTKNVPEDAKEEYEFARDLEVENDIQIDSDIDLKCIQRKAAKWKIDANFVKTLQINEIDFIDWNLKEIHSMKKNTFFRYVEIYCSPKQFIC